MPPSEQANGTAKALSPREQEVLDRVVAGRSNKQIGQALGLSPRTVEIYRHNARHKLGARNTIDLVRLTLQKA